jgi:hypothetical protein
MGQMGRNASGMPQTTQANEGLRCEIRHEPDKHDMLEDNAILMSTSIASMMKMTTKEENTE